MSLFCISLFMTLVPSLLFAQMPVMSVPGEKQASAVTLQRMDIDVEIFGNVAVTTMTMVFHNHTARILEGELTFPMPEGVTVSRYAIDINGKLREAVPVPKEKATEVFESIEHRQVDPGLLERVEGNHFRTRIYPLPAKGERTAVIAYEETLPFGNRQAMQYHLPLDYPKAIPSFSLRAKVYRAVQRPQLVELPDQSFAFRENDQVYEASMRKTDFRPSRALTVHLPKETNVPEAVLQKNRDGSFYFLINTSLQEDERPKTWSSRLGILWDNSLSGLHRDHAREWELLDRIIRQKRNLTVELGFINIRFEKAKTFTVRNGDWTELKTFLQNTVYDGGTDFSQLRTTGFSAEEYLLFSDGLSTFGENAVSIQRPVYCISSSVRADYSVLKGIGQKTGGKFVNLVNTSVDDAFRQLNRTPLQFLGIEEKELVSEVYPSAPVETDHSLSVAGIVRRASGELTLLFGHGGKPEIRQKVKTEYAENDLNVSRAWAQKKLAEMDVLYERNREDIERLGRQFGIVTRHTSLLVLESAADYARYEITPPAELLGEYQALVKNRRVEKEERVGNLLERAVASVNDLKAWWNTDFKPEKKYPEPADKQAAQEAVVEEMETMENATVESRADETFALSEMEDASPVIASEFPVAAERADRSANSRRAKAAAAPRPAPPPPPAAEIRVAKIRSDRAYMQELLAASDPYAVYLSLRGEYMETPAFFLDVSGFFYERKQSATGLLILSCLAELDVENAGLFKTLAYRLKEHGEYARELFVTQKVREWRPMDLQSHRDCALALQDNGRYREALDGLYGILKASYSPDAAARDNGIEEILVCEINNLISRHRGKLKTDSVDSRLIAGLPVDIRVVINWNKSDTDIDLWVIDPNGEKCFYSHRQTAIGGRLSNDFTRGYGPEQFLLKKAIKGTYQVKTNFFGERQLTLSGPTTVMGEIYLYYSDGRQERKVITFQSDGNATDRGEILIGEFVFSGEK
ncbi:MAG: hypothetical protein LBL42_05795 [Tannerella sp.]|nr:hypothetical protein [Tannerella sp.]